MITPRPTAEERVSHPDKKKASDAAGKGSNARLSPSFVTAILARAGDRLHRTPLLRHQDLLSALDVCRAAAHTREVPGSRADPLGGVKSTGTAFPAYQRRPRQSSSRSHVLTAEDACIKAREVDRSLD